MQKVFMVIGHKDMFVAWLSLPLKIMTEVGAALF